MPEPKYEPSALVKRIATDLDYLTNKGYCLHSLGSEDRERSVVNLISDAIHVGAYNALFPQGLVEKEEKTNA